MKARDNPFASHRIEALAYRFAADDDWEKLLGRLEATAWRGAIIGPHGGGKTTVLTQLEPLLIARGYKPRRVTLRAPDHARERQEALASIAPMRAPDFLMLDGAEMLTTRQWLSLLDELVHELCEAWLPDGEAQRLFSRHHGNLRECFGELYDRWAG